MDVEELVNGDCAPGPEPDPDPMDLILTWIGFDQAPIRERIRTEGFESFEDLLAMKEKDIWDLANSYARRILQSCLNFQIINLPTSYLRLTSPVIFSRYDMFCQFC